MVNQKRLQKLIGFEPKAPPSYTPPPHKKPSPGYTSPSPSIPSKPIVEPEPVITTGLEPLKDKPVLVTYRTPTGQVKSFYTQDITQATKTLSGEIISIKEHAPIGKPSWTYYDASKEVTGSPTLQQKELVSYIKSGREVPSWYREKVIVPSEVHELGLGEEYIRVGYESQFSRSLLFRYSGMRFEKKFERTYKALPPKEQFTYGLKYGELRDKPVGEWRSYVGGYEYLSSLPSKEKESILGEYLESKEWKTFITSPTGMEKLKTTISSMAREGLGPLDIVVMETVPQVKAEKRLAHQMLYAKDVERTIWESYPFQVRAKRLVQEGAVGAGLWLPSLVETGLHFVFKTPTPVRKWTGKRFISYTPSLIEAPISEGIGLVTGEESKAFEKLTEKPIRVSESIIKTGGEIFGLYTGSQIYHVSKLQVGRVTRPIARGIESRLGIPSLAAYRPLNLLRRVWWKGKERFGLAKFIPEEKVWDPGVLADKTRFAELPGAGRQLKAFEGTRLIDIIPEEEIVGIHAAGHRFGKLTFIRKGTSETPGLSVSAYGRGSPHFLRIGSGYGYSSTLPARISFFPQLHLPTAPLFALKKVFRLPKSVRHSFDKASSYLKGLKRGPYAHIAPKAEMGGPELEAILGVPRGSIGLRTSSFYYTTYKGVVVPLPAYKLLGKGIPSVSKFPSRISSEVKDFLSISYQSVPSVPIVHPGFISSLISKSFVGSSVLSHPSISSYPSPRSYVSEPSIFSYPSISSKISYPSYPSKPSYPSYPSYPSSSLRSYISKPSIPSYPSKPSYPSYPPVSPIPSYPHYPLYPLPSTDGKIKKKPLEKDVFGTGYRFRRWKVPELEDFINVKW